MFPFSIWQFHKLYCCFLIAWKLVISFLNLGFKFDYFGWNEVNFEVTLGHPNYSNIFYEHFDVFWRLSMQPPKLTSLCLNLMPSSFLWTSSIVQPVSLFDYWQIISNSLKYFSHAHNVFSGMFISEYIHWINWSQHEPWYINHNVWTTPQNLHHPRLSPPPPPPHGLTNPRTSTYSISSVTILSQVTDRQQHKTLHDPATHACGTVT